MFSHGAAGQITERRVVLFMSLVWHRFRGSARGVVPPSQLAHPVSSLNLKNTLHNVLMNYNNLILFCEKIIANLFGSNLCFANDYRCQDDFEHDCVDSFDSSNMTRIQPFHKGDCATCSGSTLKPPAVEVSIRKDLTIDQFEHTELVGEHITFGINSVAVQICCGTIVAAEV